MATESAGAAPQEGFRYQRRAAAYYFLTGNITNFSGTPEKLYIEKHDDDFSFIIEDDERVRQHFFEAKHTNTGELKWNVFKEKVFPEFYRISKKHANSGKKDREYYHLVTNGAVADRIKDFVDDAESLRHGTPWNTFVAKYGRDDLEKLMSGIESNDPVDNDGAVDKPDEKSDLYSPLWGIVVHTPTFDEIEAKIENYLRDCSPANFRKPKLQILEEIQEHGGGVIKRRELEEKTGISLDASTQSTTTSSQKSFGEIKENVEDMRDSFTSTTPKTAKIKQNREDVREFSERLDQLPDTDETTIESAREIVDDQFGDLEEIEQEKYETEAQIGAQLDQLLEQADHNQDD